MGFDPRCRRPLLLHGQLNWTVLSGPQDGPLKTWAPTGIQFGRQLGAELKFEHVDVFHHVFSGAAFRDDHNPEQSPFYFSLSEEIDHVWRLQAGAGSKDNIVNLCGIVAFYIHRSSSRSENLNKPICFAQSLFTFFISLEFDAAVPVVGIKLVPRLVPYRILDYVKVYVV
ncbi:hypothetical protein J6590_085846 [Homalodisca vitripennis]|nr:hypothetical protein J6590_085846 [Homalodisca vitripennis]